MAIAIPTDAYCDLADLRAALPQRTFSATSVPTDAQAETHIKDVAEEINAVVGRVGYAIPVSDTRGVKVLKQVNIYGAAAKVERAIAAGAGGVSEAAAQYEDLYQDRLDRLSKNTLRLGTVGSPANARPEGQTTLQADEPTVTRDPKFTMEDNF